MYKNIQNLIDLVIKGCNLIKIQRHQSIDRETKIPIK